MEGDIPGEYFLLASISENREVELYQIDAFSFGDMCVGDRGGGFTFEAPAENVEKCVWAPAFEGAAKKNKLNMAQLEELLNDLTQPLTRQESMPTLPPLTFNEFDPTRTHPPLSSTLGKDEEGKTKLLVVAVRYVNHLRSDKGKALKFSNNGQIFVEDGDGIDAIREAVEGKDGKISKQNDEEFNAGLMLEKTWKEKWAIQYFAMPQAPGSQKLFRYPTQRKGSSGCLTEFLCQADFVLRLYMEAHIWPRPKCGKRV